MIKIIDKSHVDHGLNAEQLDWVLAQFADRTDFMLATIELPAHLGTVPCNLIGPATGGEPVPEGAVFYAVRAKRSCASRMIATGIPVDERRVTVIAGPAAGHEGIVLYTAYGGPCAPREPGDTTIPTWEAVVEARAFWAQHALIG